MKSNDSTSELNTFNLAHAGRVTDAGKVARLEDELQSARHRYHLLERSESILMERIMRVVEAKEADDDGLLEDTIYEAEVTVAAIRRDKHEH